MAGGLRSHEDIVRMQALGAAAVQRGTPFVASEECEAHPVFKQVLAEAGDDELLQFTSAAGLPARAVRMRWLPNYLRVTGRLQASAHRKPRCTPAFDCLAPSAVLLAASAVWWAVALAACQPGALGVLALAGAVIGLGRGCIDLTRVATQGSLRGFLAPSLAVAELLAWAGRHGGWLGRPRADGRPG